MNQRVAGVFFEDEEKDGIELKCPECGNSYHITPEMYRSARELVLSDA
ncbi:hypothetical protein HY450_01670 [Candidatus Pacearchaeota archaeon]|nr:hypothetical protein [Candidatus Pacearchaeota archaeon]